MCVRALMRKAPAVQRVGLKVARASSASVVSSEVVEKQVVFPVSERFIK